MNAPELAAAAAEASPWLTVREAAARAKVSTKLIYGSVTAGRLKAARLGARNDIRIHRSWLDAWMEAATIINPDAPGSSEVPLPTALAFPSSRRRPR